MATVDQIAKQQRKALADRIAADRAALEDAIAALETRIIALARKRLETDDAEKLLGPKVNLKMAQKLHADLVKEFKTKYDKEVRKVVDGYGRFLDEFENLITGNEILMDRSQGIGKLSGELAISGDTILAAGMQNVKESKITLDHNIQVPG